MIDAQVACQLFQTAFFCAAAADFEFELRIGFECFGKSRQEQVVAFEVTQVGDTAEGKVLIVFFRGNSKSCSKLPPSILGRYCQSVPA